MLTRGMATARVRRPGARAVLAALLMVCAWFPRSAPAHLLDDCPEEDHCTADAQCNDRDPCTSDVCELAGDGVDGEGCCTHEAITPCLDAFLCYDVAASKGTPRFSPVPGVHLVDWLEDARFTVTEPRALCNPADLEGEGVHDPVTHLDRYQIVPVFKRAPRAKAAGVSVETALGVVQLDVVRGDKLLVPAAKSLATPPPALEGAHVDHFKCYDVVPSRGAAKFPQGLHLTLADQFTRAPKVFAVAGPKHLCAAADEDGGGVEDACAALLCYGVKAGAGEPRFSRTKGVRVRDDFGLRQVDVVAEDEACLPAVVNDRTCLARGFACAVDGECSTGHCAGGVCCETACDTPCHACLGSLTGEPHGTCAPIDPALVNAGAPGSECPEAGGS
jgi:hypothetical protein